MSKGTKELKILRESVSSDLLQQIEHAHELLERSESADNLKAVPSENLEEEKVEDENGKPKEEEEEDEDGSEGRE